MIINVISRLASIPFAIALIPGGSVATPVFAADTGPGASQVCVQVDGAPTDRCVDIDAMSLQMKGGLGDGKMGARGSDLVVQLDPAELDRFMAIAGGGPEVEICVIEGANICPPEPFELIWVCITTGMLAGTECPTPPETDTAVATVRLQSGG